MYLLLTVKLKIIVFQLILLCNDDAGEKSNGNTLLFYLVLLFYGYAFVYSGKVGESEQESLVQ